KKKCYECGKSDIENSKHKYPYCNAKLPTLAKIHEKTNPMIPQEKDIIKLLIFKSCNPKTSKNSINLTNPLSITQISES
ncbi:10180_t:CDS:1, partial [Cetraspora pellucida]